MFVLYVRVAAEVSASPESVAGPLLIEAEGKMSVQTGTRLFPQHSSEGILIGHDWLVNTLKVYMAVPLPWRFSRHVRSARKNQNQHPSMSCRNCRVFVGHLSHRTSARDLQAAFSRFGNIRSVHLREDYGWIVGPVYFRELDPRFPMLSLFVGIKSINALTYG